LTRASPAPANYATGMTGRHFLKTVSTDKLFKINDRPTFILQRHIKLKSDSKDVFFVKTTTTTRISILKKKHATAY